MLGSWSTTYIIIATFLIISLVIGIGTLGILLTEGIDVGVTTAVGRAIRTTFGITEAGPKHSTFATIYHPVVFFSMFLVTGVLLTEVVNRPRSQ